MRHAISLVLFHAFAHIDPLARNPPILVGDKRCDHALRAYQGSRAALEKNPPVGPIRWKNRETNCLASAVFKSLVAAVLVRISCGKPRIGRIHLDSRIAQLEGELWPVIE